MARHVVPLGLLILGASCAFDTSAYTPTGAGASGGASAASTGTLQGQASVTSAGGATATGTNNTATASTSGTSNTTTSSVAATATTGTGTTNLPFCTGAPIDALSPYGIANWMTSGQVTTGQSGTTLTEIPGMPGTIHAFLYTTLPVDLYSADCAITVDLTDGATGQQKLRVNIPTNMGDDVRVIYTNPAAPSMRSLAFTTMNTSQAIAPPFTIALVSRNHVLYAGYLQGGAWTLLDGTKTEPSDYAAAQIAMTQECCGNGNAGTWRNFNVTAVSLSDLGIP